MEVSSNGRCNFCDKTEHLKRCGRCKSVFYCSRDHQIRDWLSHKVTCGKHSVMEGNPSTGTCSSSNCSSEKEILEFNFVKERGADQSKLTQSGVDNVSTDLKAKNVDIGSETMSEFDKRELRFIPFEKPKRLDMFSLSEFAFSHLNQDGFCVLDGLLSGAKCKQILEEIKKIHKNGLFKTGKLAGGETSGIEEEKVVNTGIRSDTMTWLNGTETEEYPRICDLIENTMDILVAGLNAFSKGDFLLQGKTKAMVACYPGNGTAYKRHVDNPSGDGRLVTCIVYMNENWDCRKQGGNLRVFPTSSEGSYVDIEPKMNRLLLFWSDHRTPHEVQPAYDTRYAITIWYFDQRERENAKKTATLNKELEGVRDEISLIDLKKKQTEKMVLEQKIENEAIKAVQALSEEEMQALCAMVSEHSNPREVLQQLGIGKAIQDHLVKEINRRLGRT